MVIVRKPLSNGLHSYKEYQERLMVMTQTRKKQIPARTPEGRENQLINLAMNLAEEKLRDGTASSQIITSILNWATTKHQLENDKLRADLEVAKAKVEQMKRSEDSKDLYEKALAAFRSYQSDSEDEFDDEDY